MILLTSSNAIQIIVAVFVIRGWHVLWNSVLDDQVGPVLEAMEDILAALLRSLDGRVYVAVGRGLWDFTAKDIYDYVDSLQEGKENKVCAQSCSGPKQAYCQCMMQGKCCHAAWSWQAVRS